MVSPTEVQIDDVFYEVTEDLNCWVAVEHVGNVLLFKIVDLVHVTDVELEHRIDKNS